MAQVGEIIMWGGSSETFPPGFLNCNGEQKLQKDFAALYAVIGNNFGASPLPGNFFLPDLRSRFIRGFYDGAHRDPDPALRTDMQNPSVPYAGVGSIQPDAFRVHAHPMVGTIENQTSLAAGQDYGGAQMATFPAGGNETRPINANLYFLICHDASLSQSR